MSILKRTSLCFVGSDSNILQLAALSCDTREEINIFITPERPIPTKISSLTGIDHHAGQMYCNFKPVDSVGIGQGLTAFVNFIQANPGPTVLVAHNAKFDARILLSTCERLGERMPANTVFADSLPLLRQCTPGLAHHKLTDLYRHAFGEAFQAHSAVEDVRALAKLLLHYDINQSKLVRHLFSQQQTIRQLTELTNSKTYKGSYGSAVADGVLKNAQSDRLSRSGIGLQHLRLSFERAGLEGLEAILKARGAGKYFKRIAQSLSDYFRK